MAGLLIAAFGTGPTLLINSFTFIAVIIALLAMDTGALTSPPRAAKRGRVRDGVAYVRRRPDILLIMALVFVHGTFGMNFQIFNALMATTGERDAFGVHTPEYYQLAYELFVPRGWARLLLAEIEGEAVAAVMIFAIRDHSWYFYGASGDAHREKMPTYLLQWEGMRWARSLGCTSYDLWGVPDADEATRVLFERSKENLVQLLQTRARVVGVTIGTVEPRVHFGLPADRLLAAWRRYQATGMADVSHDTLDDAHILNRWIAAQAEHPAITVLELERCDDAAYWREVVDEALELPEEHLSLEVTGPTMIV